jgi:hypothetical protein
MAETVRSNLNVLRRFSKDAAAQYSKDVPEFMRRKQPMSVFPDQGENSLVAVINLTVGDLVSRAVVSRIHESAQTCFGLVKAIMKDLPHEVNFKKSFLSVEVRYIVDPSNPRPGEVESICFSKFVNTQGIALEFFWDKECTVYGLGLYRKELRSDRDVFVSQYSPVSLDGVVQLAKGSKIPQLNPSTRVNTQGLLFTMMNASATEVVNITDFVV